MYQYLLLRLDFGCLERRLLVPNRVHLQVAKRHIEIGCCAVQAPSKGRVEDEGEKERRETFSHWSLVGTTLPFEGA